MKNPLIEKYNQLYNPKPPEPPKDPYSHLRYEDRKLIYKLETLIEDLKTGKASFQNYEAKNNYRSIPPHFWGIEPSSNIDLKYDEGQMITIQVFRSYD